MGVVEYKTSNEWAKEYAYSIKSPDGWNRVDFEYSFNVESITRVEFEKRLSKSTLIDNGTLYKRRLTK